MSSFEDRSTSLLALIDYVSLNGGVINSSIDFVPSTAINSKQSSLSVSTDYGIIATSDIGEKDLLISVPYHVCITTELIISSPLLKDLFDVNPGLKDYPDEVLAIGLMHCRLYPLSTCAWKQHMEVLPETFNTTIYWTEEELAHLNGHVVHSLTKMMLRQIDTDFNTIHLPLSMEYPHILGGVTIELYKWALSIVYSRALEITRRQRHVRCIVPLLDLANHNPCSDKTSFDTFEYNDAVDAIQFVSSSVLRKGDECYAVYGMYPNSKLLYTYGFVVMNNPHRAIDLWVKVNATTYRAADKSYILQNHELTNNQSYDFKGTLRPNYVSPALLTTIRVIQADDDDMMNIERAYSGHMVSYRNEAATYTSLRNLIIARMKIDEAESDKLKLGELLLADTDCSDRRLCSMIVKVEERELLVEVLTMVNGWIDSLDLLKEEYVPSDGSIDRQS